ncbi:MAG: signal peptidase I [Pirellulaceae bacterium]|jgi:signal peptidase I
MNAAKKNKSASKHKLTWQDHLHATVAGSRETVESIVLAVILAFMFRAFVAEAFIIPTGSMATTLQGRHKDLNCLECGYQFKVGASQELRDGGMRIRSVSNVACPICGHNQTVKPDTDANHVSFSGDRIIVSKFIYDLREPARWDVIVFKYPGNAVQNYIKRLVGLPNETLRVFQGSIYTKGLLAPDTDFAIARKKPHKIKAMLQLVDDTNHIPATLQKVNWPSRWQSREGETVWSAVANAKFGFVCQPTANDTFLRYYHRVPGLKYRIDEWKEVLEQKRLPETVEPRQGSLISDFCVYNVNPHSLYTLNSAWDQRSQDRVLTEATHPTGLEYPNPNPGNQGLHWVGDLAVEADIEIQSVDGELLLDLVKGGVHYECRIDVATGIATLNIVGADFGFDGSKTPTGATAIRGKGTHHLRFANVDNGLTLWVDETVVEFDSEPNYTIPRAYEVPLRPVWSPQDHGDLAPTGIGGKGLQLQVDRLKVHRDIYYIALTTNLGSNSDYMASMSFGGSQMGYIRGLFSDPTTWAAEPLFNSFNYAQFDLDEEQFFPMGDNSAASKDARIWAAGGGHRAPGAFVERRMLLGKAVLIYWPHPWNTPVPFTPNVQEMGLIR